MAVKTIELHREFYCAVVYSDDDGDSGYGENAMIGYWYGTREECEAIDLEAVELHPITERDFDPGPPYDAATATGMYDAW